MEYLMNESITVSVPLAVSVAVVVGTILVLAHLRISSANKQIAALSKPQINSHINLTSPKVVNKVDLLELFDDDDVKMKALCRCWKSQKWPYCDGAHAKHNKETGDNIGPLLITRNSQ